MTAHPLEFVAHVRPAWRRIGRLGGALAASWALSTAAGAAPVSFTPTIFFDYELANGEVSATDPEGICVNPFAGCTMSVYGLATGRISGDLSFFDGWAFGGSMNLSPLSDTQWALSGHFAFNRFLDFPGETHAAFGGTYAGVFDAVSSTARIDYTVDHAEGDLAGYAGSGRSTVTIRPGPTGGSFDDLGRFELGKVTPVPLPGTPALAMLALWLAATTRRPPAGGDRTRRVAS